MQVRFQIIFVSVLILSCAKADSGRIEGVASADFNCAGQCTNLRLSEDDIRLILRQAVAASILLESPSTIAITDRVGNVLALYQMEGAEANTIIDGQTRAEGGLEGLEVPSVLAAISKAGTGAFLSSQGNAFSTRTASQIIQENFNPGDQRQPGGPLFGVQFSQLLCSDIVTRQDDFKDARDSGNKDSYSGFVGPRPLPLGLSADPGGIPLYKEGDVVGGIGIELDGAYRLDRNVFDYDDDVEERIAMMASVGYEAPSKRVAPNINVGKSFRYVDLSYNDLAEVNADSVALDDSNFVGLAEFTDTDTPGIREGSVFGEAASGILKTTRAGNPAAILVDDSGNERFPVRAGTSLGGDELTTDEVNALLDSVFLTALRTRAAIRRPLDSHAHVSIWIVDQVGRPLGFVRTEDAPVFGIDVALQKARTAAFFSSADAGTAMNDEGFDTFVTAARELLGEDALTGQHAFTDRAGGNLSRPFLPDGVQGTSNGPFSYPLPGAEDADNTWSPFNTGFQLALVFSNLAQSLGLVAGDFPDSCAPGSLETRLAGGIQIFPGSIPLYRGETLVGAIGISGDGIDQDDLIAFYGASRPGLDRAGHTSIGDASLGFNAPKNIRADRIKIPGRDIRLRYVSCPEAPFLGSNRQNVCSGL